MTRGQWASLLRSSDLDGAPMPLERDPGRNRAARAAAGPPPSASPASTGCRASRGDGVPAVRAQGRARRASSPSSGSRARCARRVWGCRGSLAAPGRGDGALRRQHVVRRGPAGRRHDPRARRRHRRRPSGLELSPTARPDPPAAHASPPRPPPGAGLLPAALARPENEVHIWGPASPAGSLARPDRALPLAAALPDRSSPTSRRSSLPRRAGRAVEDRRRADHGRATCPSGPDRRLPDRGGRRVARVHPRPRAGARGTTSRTLPPDWISGQQLAQDADVLLHDAQYSEERVRRPVGWGHSSVAPAVAFARGGRPGGSCSSTTIRCTPTATWCCCRPAPASSGTATGAAGAGARG